MITGCIGDSPENDHVRVYLNFDLSEYVDVPEKAILHTEEISSDQVPSGSCFVWINRDVEVVHEPITQPVARKATFLEGRISRNFARQNLAQQSQINSIQAQAQQPAAIVSRFSTCPSLVDGCRSALIDCNSQFISTCGGPLISRFITCFSQLTACQSRFDACPSALISCDSQLVITCGGGTISQLTACPSLVDGCSSSLGCSSAIGCGLGDIGGGFQGRRF